MISSTQLSAPMRGTSVAMRPPSPPAALPREAFGAIEDDDHIVVLGGPGCELMCALLRAGASNVTHLRAHERPEAGGASLLIVPRVPSLDWLAALLPSMHRALTQNGRLAIEADPRTATMSQISRMLTLNGFRGIRAAPATPGVESRWVSGSVPPHRAL